MSGTAPAPERPETDTRIARLGEYLAWASQDDGPITDHEIAAARAKIEMADARVGYSREWS